MRAEAIVDQTRRRLIPLPQHEELLGIPYPSEEPSGYQIQAIGEGQDMQLDRLARRGAHDPVICSDHDRTSEEMISNDPRSDRDDDTLEILSLYKPDSSGRHVRVVTRAKQRWCEITFSATHSAKNRQLYSTRGRACPYTRLRLSETFGSHMRSLDPRF